MTTRPWSLRALLAGIVPVEATDDATITSLCLDSRHVRPGALFFAVAGTRVDGRAHIADAVARGAVAVLYQAGGAPPRCGVPCLRVADLPRQLGRIADRFYDSPSRELIVVGVTGTNGKTTCTQLLAQALDNNDARPVPGKNAPVRGRCAVIGTLGYGFPGQLAPATHTTPDGITVHRLLAEFRAAQANAVAMEVSSHALDQERVGGVQFDIAVFTNLTRDHLDYHGDLERYGAAKARLFDWPTLKAAVLNVDDDFGRRLVDRVRGRCRLLTYGLNAGDVRANALRTTADGLHLAVQTPDGAVEIRSSLLGQFNAANLLAVLATLLALGIDAKEAAARVGAARPVTGRMERFGADRMPLVVVDYAHTPDALEKALLALRAHTRGRLWCVFGCGGERDRGKRPQMGAIAERGADIVIVTDDNPRAESGDAIVADIVAGMHRAPRVIRDRAHAIAAAIREADADDVILIAGKGHEDYQEINGVRRPYSDRHTVRTVLETRA